MIPGMLHCGGGNGPCQVDWLSLLQDWVEHRKPPGEIIATGGETLGPHRQTLCPYPKIALAMAGDPPAPSGPCGPRLPKPAPKPPPSP
jgi:feruloyl esterase